MAANTNIESLVFSSFLFSMLAISSHASQGSDNLFELSLDELVNIPISVASRTSQPFLDTSSAVTVITQEQIHRSGFTHIPDVMRLVPGLHVGRADSNKWWVSIRGFGSRFNDKLQVMIDGRSIFTPLFNGTYWEHHMPPIEDIERIEVIRGSGGASWGSNANNGVINIITKHTEDTQGTYLSALAGDNEMEFQGLARHGFSHGKTSGRIYAQRSKHDGGELTNIRQVTDLGLEPGSSGMDSWSHDVLGFRGDTEVGQHSLTVAGEVFDAEYDQTRLTGFGFDTPVADTVSSEGYFLRAKWQLPINGSQTLTVNGNLDSTERKDGSLEEQRDTYELSADYEILAGKHQLLAGYTYQQSEDETEQVSSIVFMPADKRLEFHGIFIQDRYQLLDGRAFITAGIRYDKNDYTDWEYQPTLRGLYKLDDNQRVWASLSRAVNIPGRADVELGQQFGPIFIPIGNPDFQPETMDAIELGYRFSDSNFYFESSVFYNQYDHLNQSVGNEGSESDLFGIEFNITQQWRHNFTTSLQYSFHDNDDKDAEPDAFGLSGIDNVKQLSGVQVHWGATEKLQFNLAGFYNTDVLPESDTDAYSSNFKLDLNLQYRLNKQVNIILAGQNLLDDVDTQVIDATRLNTGVVRAYYLKAELDFN